MGAKMQQEKKISGIIYAVLFGVVTAIILLFSGFSGEISSSQSGFVVNVLNAVLRFFGIILNELQLETFAFFVRKFFGHFLIFVLDGLFAYLAIKKMFQVKQTWLMILIALTATFLVAATSEIIQLFTSGRSGNWLDVGIDLSGAIIGVAIAVFITWPIKEKTDNFSASS